MSGIFETVMLVCFGLSWPLNVIKAYKARTAKGTSLPFILLIITGYIAGITAKLISGQDFTMGIYPEGTRSFDGKLLEFKTGAFVMAKRAACPMVICKIKGTNDYHGRFPFRRTDTVFTVLEVVPAEKVKALKPEELSDYARSVIEKNL